MIWSLKSSAYFNAHFNLGKPLKVLRTFMASSYCVKHCSFNIWALLAHTNGSSMSGTFHVHTRLKEIVPDFFFFYERGDVFKSIL